MPGTYLPITATYPDGCISITSTNGISYDELLNSLISINLKCLNIFIKSNNINQLLNALQFEKYDINGNISKENIQVAIDPYQKQIALNIDVSKKDFIFNGQFFFSFPILAHETCLFILETEELSVKTILDSKNFFSTFKDKIDE